MAEKAQGEKVASIRHTFGRNNNSDHTTAQNVSAGDVDGVERDTEYFVNLSNSGRSGIDFSNIDPFIVKTHSSQTSFSIPRRLIKENGILPGHSVLVNIHGVDEIEEEKQEFVDDSSIIGRTEVVSDNTNSDGCHSSLSNETVCNYIGKDKVQLKFRNLKNGKEATGYTSQNQGRSGRFSFPISVRKQIEADAGDLIEVIAVGDEKRQSFATPEYNEKIDELYEMVSELYEAYTAGKND